MKDRMGQLRKWAQARRDGLGIAAITIGIILVAGVVIWLTVLTQGIALLVVLGVAFVGVVIATIVLIATFIWEEFFE